jgi:transcription antitermination factor NusG
MSSPLPASWYALYVRSRHEKTVYAQLEAKQHNVFLPLYTVRNKWADRWKSVSLPLFPGYVFCRFDIASRGKILATSGLIDVVRAGPEPCIIADSEIEKIQLVLNSSLSLEPYPALVTGQHVKMTDGPLCGLVGTLATIRNRSRLVVNVELLGRAVLVEIDRDWVVPCDDFQSRFPKNSPSFLTSRR